MAQYSAKLAALAIALLPAVALSQATTESRDPNRGVTMFSMELSTDSVAELQSKGALFADDDEMAIGISALFFDESANVSDYVLWVRHDGPRRWLINLEMRPLLITAENQAVEPLTIHRSLPSERMGRFSERVEFSVQPKELQSIVEADEVNFELRTVLGVVSKAFSEKEINSLRRFKERVEARHKEVQGDLEIQSQLSRPDDHRRNNEFKTNTELEGERNGYSTRS